MKIKAEVGVNASASQGVPEIARKPPEERREAGIDFPSAFRGNQPC